MKSYGLNATSLLYLSSIASIVTAIEVNISVNSLILTIAFFVDFGI